MKHIKYRIEKRKVKEISTSGYNHRAGLMKEFKLMFILINRLDVILKLVLN